MIQVFAVIGALLILVAYAGVQLGRTDADRLGYLLLNTVGSLALSVVAAIEEQWGFLLLEVAWLVISLLGLARPSRSAGDAVPTHPYL